jgi:hypothetical protein
MTDGGQMGKHRKPAGLLARVAGALASLGMIGVVASIRVAVLTGIVLAATPAGDALVGVLSGRTR